VKYTDVRNEILNKSLAISVDVKKETLISLAMCMDVTKNTESIL